MENDFQSAAAFYCPTKHLKGNNYDNGIGSFNQVNLVKMKVGVTTNDFTMDVNAGVNVAGFNGFICNVSASAQYTFSNNSVMKIQCDNNLGQEMRRVYGGLNYGFGNTANIIFEINNNWMFFRFNLKY